MELGQFSEETRKKHEQMYYTTCKVEAHDATGSGVVVQSKRWDIDDLVRTYILTNHHVIESCINIKEKWDPSIKKDRKQEILDPLSVKFFEHNNYSRAVGSNNYEADIVAYDHQDSHDVALLQLRDDENIIEPVANLYPYEHRKAIFMFDKVYAVGSGLGAPVFQTPGEVTSAYIELGGQPFIGTNADITRGNCITGDSLISLVNGSVKPIRDIEVGDYVWTMGLHGDYLDKQPVEKIFSSGEKEVFEVKTGNRTVKASGNHPLLTVQKVKDARGHLLYYMQWKPIVAIEEGELIATLQSLPDKTKGQGLHIQGEVGVRVSPKDFMRWVGFYLGDGYSRYRQSHGGEVTLYAFDDELAQKYCDISQQMFSEATVKIKNENERVKVYSAEAARQVESWGITGQAHSKTIPDWVMAKPKPLQRAFVEGYLDADGHITADGTWQFEATSEELITRLRLMLIHMGVKVSNLSPRDREEKTINGRTVKNSRTAYQFGAYPKGIKGDSLPRNGHKDFIAQNLNWERVQEIQSIGQRKIYDIQLKVQHNFFADGVLVHNSGGGLFKEDAGDYYLIALPARVSLQGYGDIANHMGYAVPIEIVYEILEEHCFEHIWDDSHNPVDDAERRQEKVEKAKRGRH